MPPSVFETRPHHPAKSTLYFERVVVSAADLLGATPQRRLCRWQT